MGWVIMQGSSENPDEDFVCQSNPKNACELKASSDGRKAFSQVHVYYHPVGAPVRYEGTTRISFFGDGGSSLPVNVTVDGRDVKGSSIIGLVSNKPGEYLLAVDVTANAPSGPVRISEQVPVVVK